MKDSDKLEAFLIKDNPLYKECLRLATNSKSKSMRFGSMLVKDGQILGRGWNRRVEARRPVMMGYANHAEIESLNDALERGFDVKDSAIYVAGYFSYDGSVYAPKAPVYTCVSCPPYLERYEIDEIFIPLASGWRKIYVKDAKESSREFLGNSCVKRAYLGKRRITVEDIIG